MAENDEKIITQAVKYLGTLLGKEEFMFIPETVFFD